VYAISGNA